MSAPARLRDMYVIGRHGSYFCPTVKACDETLRVLRSALHLADDLFITDTTLERVRADIDRVLDRRTDLAIDENAAEAIRLARGT